ncbi:glycosyltransferase [Pseudalkalibacillus berkeleyi]|uniref:Glycosyltransferase n=1 Tax=Pseudalkalibacillus berkeleyi TaxID=1069813 RepID=A0ABS9GZ72_9BACL|nr:glycosyltransferase [Pseudalkalibacillus berkeleyi]MCF6136893.1 glycosyltransferase [Pseudalkalibacillus berkeleyi]
MVNDRPKISVVIPFYNCPYIHLAIRSVLRQTYRNYEIIVVDDGSTLNQNLISPYLKQIKYYYKDNGGTATALNKGIQVASGDLIAWLSSDDIFLRNKLHRQVQYMQETGADMVYTNFSLINERNRIIRENVGLVLGNRKDLLKRLPISCPINGSSVLVKKEIFTNVGLFDPTLRYTQDYDMWIRMAAKAKIEMLNETLLHYRHHENMGSKLYVEEQWKEIKQLQDKYKGMLARLIHCEELGYGGECDEI